MSKHHHRRQVFQEASGTWCISTPNKKRRRHRDGSAPRTQQRYSPTSPRPSPSPRRLRFRCYGAGEQTRGSAPSLQFSPNVGAGWVGIFTLGAQCEPPFLESWIDAAFPDGLRRVLCGVLSQQFESRLMEGTSRRRRLPNSLLAGWLLAGGCVCSALHRGGVESGWVCSAAAAAAAAGVWEGGLVMVCLLLVVVKFEDGRRCAQTKQSSRFSDVGPEEAKRSRWSVECRWQFHRETIGFAFWRGAGGGRGVCAGIFNDVNSHGGRNSTEPMVMNI